MIHQTLSVARYEDRLAMAKFIADIADSYGFETCVNAEYPSRVILHVVGCDITFATSFLPSTTLFAGNWGCTDQHVIKWMPGSVVRDGGHGRVATTLATDFGTFAVLLDAAFWRLCGRAAFSKMPPILETRAAGSYLRFDAPSTAP